MRNKFKGTTKGKINVCLTGLD